MPLVDYASSSSSDPSPPSSPQRDSSRKRTARSGGNGRASKAPRPAPPPLPSAFRDLYATTVRASNVDDPALHQGRTRITPHIDGNWPSHVYIEWHPSVHDAACLSALVDSVVHPVEGASITSALTSDLGVPAPLHISLSCPLQLRTEARHRFVNEVERSLRQSDVNAFHVKLERVDWASNAAGNRWFLALRMAKPENDELNRLLEACNTVARASGLDALYAHELKEDDSGARRQGRGEGIKQGDCTERFHFSIGWSLERPFADDHTQVSQAKVGAEALTEVSELRVYIESIKVKTGNEITVIPLHEPTGEHHEAS